MKLAPIFAIWLAAAGVAQANPTSLAEFLERKPAARTLAQEAHVTRERQLVFVDHATYELRLFEAGVLVGQLSVGLGQVEGEKVQKGDLRTPRGVYFVVEKKQGGFTGKWAAFFGGYFIRLNYPGPNDAERAVNAGWLTRAEADQMTAIWRSRKLPRQDTALGGGIGLHGWAGEWQPRADGRALLSFGCVVLHNRDMPTFFGRLSIGVPVVFF